MFLLGLREEVAILRGEVQALREELLRHLKDGERVLMGDQIVPTAKVMNSFANYLGLRWRKGRIVEGGFEKAEEKDRPC